MIEFEDAAVIGFLIAAVLGIRATVRLWQTYVDAGGRHVILLAFAVIATLITIVATMVGLISLRRILGYDPLPWTPPLLIIGAGVIFLIPAGLEWLVAYIARQGD